MNCPLLLFFNYPLFCTNGFMVFCVSINRCIWSILFNVSWVSVILLTFRSCPCSKVLLRGEFYQIHKLLWKDLSFSYIWSTSIPIWCILHTFQSWLNELGWEVNFYSRPIPDLCLQCQKLLPLEWKIWDHAFLRISMTYNNIGTN